MNAASNARSWPVRQASPTRRSIKRAGRSISRPGAQDRDHYERLRSRTLRAPAASHPNTGGVTMVHTGELYRRPRSTPVSRRLATVGARKTRRHASSLGGDGRRTGHAAEIKKRGLGERVHVVGQIPMATPGGMMTSDILLLVHTPGQPSASGQALRISWRVGRRSWLAEPDGDAAWVLRKQGAASRRIADRCAGAFARRLSSCRAARAGEPVVLIRTPCVSSRESMAQRVAECLDDVAAPKQKVSVP